LVIIVARDHNAIQRNGALHSSDAKIKSHFLHRPDQGKGQVGIAGGNQARWSAFHK
jgi:hypothetical protein